MCAGNQRRNAEHEAAKRQREADAVAAQRQAEMNRLAAERQATAATQQAQLRQMQEQAAAEQGLQQAEVDRLRAQQQERLAGLQSMGTAVSQSLRILGSAGSQQAPTAAVAPRQKEQAGARSTTASLRMGATSQGRGSGVNVAV
jgi:hypothetical protein